RPAGEEEVCASIAVEGVEPLGAFPGKNGRSRAAALPLGVAQVMQRAGSRRSRGGFLEKPCRWFTAIGGITGRTLPEKFRHWSRVRETAGCDKPHEEQNAKLPVHNLNFSCSSTRSNSGCSVNNCEPSRTGPPKRSASAAVNRRRMVSPALPC